MAESKTKRGKAEDGVLASLPATRPSRLSRRARTDSDAPADKPKAAAAKPRATAAKPRAAKPKPAKPVAVAEAPKPQRPRPVRASSPNLTKPAAKAEENREPEAPRGPSGTELVTTVVKATGELASIGATVAGQILKRAVERLPRR